MQSSRFFHILTGALASLTLLAASPAGAAELMPAFLFYTASNSNSAQNLLLVDNGRFAMSFSVGFLRSESMIKWLGSWQQKGKKLCLTPDPPAFFLYGSDAGNEVNDGDDDGDYMAEPQLLIRNVGTIIKGPYAAIALSKNAEEIPTQFYRLTKNTGSLTKNTGIPLKDWMPAYLFVARQPQAGNALEVWRYPLSPSQRDYVLFSTGGIPHNAEDILNDDGFRMIALLFLSIFSEYKQAPDLLETLADATKNKQNSAVIRKHAKNLVPPYCGTLDQTRMQAKYTEEPLPETREAYLEFVRNLREESVRADALKKMLAKESPSDQFQPIEGANLGRHTLTLDEED